MIFHAEGKAFAVAARHLRYDAHAAWGASAGACQARLGTGLVEEHESIRLDVLQLLVPEGTAIGDVGPVLFACVQRLFLSGRSSLLSHLLMD